MRGKKPTFQQAPKRGRNNNRAPPPLAIRGSVVGSVGCYVIVIFGYSDISSCTRPQVCTQVMFEDYPSIHDYVLCLRFSRNIASLVSWIALWPWLPEGCPATTKILNLQAASCWRQANWYGMGLYVALWVMGLTFTCFQSDCFHVFCIGKITDLYQGKTRATALTTQFHRRIKNDNKLVSFFSFGVSFN